MPGRLIGMTGIVAGLGVVQGPIPAFADAFDGTGDTSTTAGFFFNDPPTTEIYTLSLHAALPISPRLATRTFATECLLDPCGGSPLPPWPRGQGRAPEPGRRQSVAQRARIPATSRARRR